MFLIFRLQIMKARTKVIRVERYRYCFIAINVRSKITAWNHMDAWATLSSLFHLKRDPIKAVEPEVTAILYFFADIDEMISQVMSWELWCEAKRTNKN